VKKGAHHCRASVVEQALDGALTDQLHLHGLPLLGTGTQLFIAWTNRSR
jgi:hypothetical protein